MGFDKHLYSNQASTEIVYSHSPAYQENASYKNTAC